MDLDLYVCKGTDIHPVSSIEFCIYSRILQLINENNANILSMDDIFDGYNHTKTQRFDLISRLIKKRIINRNRFDAIRHCYELIPKMTYKESKEVRVYYPKTRRARQMLIEEFMKK